jgi:hypothetical protein
MKIFSKREAGEWCNLHGVHLDESALPAVRTIADATDFPIPGDAGRRVALTTGQMWNLAIDSGCLVWLDDWNAWPSGQWYQLFERFRLSYGCHDPLAASPAHLVGKSEFDAAISIAVYAVLMLWDCYVVTDQGAWIYYSHDEVGRMKKGEPRGVRPGSGA